MVSTATSRLRLQKQGTGDNSGTWGSELNTTVFDLLDTAIAGVTAVTVSGPVTLTTNNYAADQARAAILHITGTGGTVTLPNVSKAYIVRIDASGTVTFNTGGIDVDVSAGGSDIIWTDGTDCYSLLSGLSLSGAVVGTQSAKDSTTKAASTAYVDTALAWPTLDTQATTSGTSWDFTLTTGYKDYIFEFRGVSGNGSTFTPKIATSHDGATWTAAGSLSESAFSSSGAIYGDVRLFNRSGPTGWSLACFDTLGSDNTGGNGGGITPIVGVPWRHSTGVTHVRFTLNGATGDAGSIVAKGR
jgi:hypothetical protein